MALLKYFNRDHVNVSSKTVPPNPDSSLNQVVDRKVHEVPLSTLEQTDHVCKHLDYSVSCHLVIVFQRDAIYKHLDVLHETTYWSLLDVLHETM